MLDAARLLAILASIIRSHRLLYRQTPLEEMILLWTLMLGNRLGMAPDIRLLTF